MPVQPCPGCGTETPRKLDAASQQARVNYYRCPTCGHVWTTTKDGGAILDHVTPAPSIDTERRNALKLRASALHAQSAKAREDIQETQNHLQQALHHTAEVIGHTQNIARSMAESSAVERSTVAADKHQMPKALEPVVHEARPDKSDG